MNKEQIEILLKNMSIRFGKKFTKDERHALEVTIKCLENTDAKEVAEISSSTQ